MPTVRDGEWRLLEAEPGWEGNWTNDCFVISAWRGPQNEILLNAVNYAHNQSQCHVRLPYEELAGKRWRLCDELGTAQFEWHGDDLTGRGLFLDMRPWEACVFSFVERT
ncbi:MAG: hypothetical protein QM811_16475 [Pirellulales bacterium]